MSQNEKELWDSVKEMIGEEHIDLGSHWAYNLWNDPKRLAFVLSRYKSAAKMGCQDKTVLELGCSEGIGAPILGEFAQHYTGVDLDQEAITVAKKNWENEKYHFIADDFLGKSYGQFETVVSMDVVEHIHQESEHLFFEAIAKNMGEDGIAIVGTPNITSVPYASAASQAGHVNMFSADRLQSSMEKYFHNCFSFGINDEIVHTGFAPMAHYLICIGCNKK